MHRTRNNMSSSRAIHITMQGERPVLSKAQKTFNRLIKKINGQKEQLSAWQAMIPLHQQQYASEFAPLLQRYNQHRADLVRLFDQAYEDKALSKTDRNKISHIICTVTAELLAEDDDETFKALYNKYSDTDFDMQTEQENKVIKSMMEGMLGIHLDDDVDFSSKEDLMAQVDQQMKKKFAEEEARQEALEERRSKRKKSTRESTRETRREMEQQHVSQSLREVFRKLASALHPDREPDPLERERKTALMQKVNVAYGNKDLLQLLELQLEVEQIDQSALDRIPEDRLKHYNKVLTEQSAELQQELDAVEFSFKARFGFHPDDALSPDSSTLR